MAPATHFEARSSDMCSPFIAVLPIDRMAVSTLGDPFQLELVYASDGLAATLSELQLNLGEGPSWAAYRAQTPVLVPNPSADGDGSWPMYSNAVSAFRLQAIYSFPLTLGALFLGTVDLYADDANSMTPIDVVEASVMVDAAASSVLAHALRHLDGEIEAYGVLSRREVHQATGMVIVQASVNPDDALLLIRARAFAVGRPVRDVAADIIARRTVFAS